MIIQRSLRGLSKFCVAWMVVSAAVGASGTTPFTATKSFTAYEVDASGHATLTHQEIGTFARSADGSEAYHMKDVTTGKLTAGLIKTNGQAVSLNYAKKQYSIQPSGPDASAIPMPLLKPGMEAQMVNGVYAIAIPVRDGTMTGKITGKSWYSPEYKLVVRSETDHTLPNGTKLRFVNELKDFAAGATPDAELFAVPADFAAVSGTTVCANCNQGKTQP